MNYIQHLTIKSAKDNNSEIPFSLQDDIVGKIMILHAFHEFRQSHEIMIG